MVPAEGLAAFDGLPTPEHVVLSCRHHDRDHAQFVEAFGADFHVSEHGVQEYPGEDVQAYAVGDQIVPGMTAVANGPIAPDDTVLKLDVEGGALAFADSLLSAGGADRASCPTACWATIPSRCAPTSRRRSESCWTRRSSSTCCSRTAIRWSAGAARRWPLWCKTPAERAIPRVAATVREVGLPTVAPERFRS